MADPVGLDAQGITVRFGGATALDAVSLRADPGRITSLIGPNGGGKTTFFNACTGVIRPHAGSVSVAGVDVTKWPVPRRAQLGLGRTFQRMELFDSMSVAENVALGREALLSGNRPLGHLRSPKHERDEITEATADAISQCGLEEMVDTLTRDLSTGQRRLVELARVIAGGFSLLLLDEPSSGLDPDETKAFGDTVVGLVERGKIGVLLVEHDMELVMSISDHVYVLDFGRLIFDGSAAGAQDSTVVHEAYLGAS